MTDCDTREIIDRMEIEEGQGVWILDDCVVREVENDGDCHAFEVYMLTANDSISRQTIIPSDADASDSCRAALDEGESPVGAWEDGLGRTIDPENGEIVDGGYSFEDYNGNNGNVKYFDTAEEAVNEADACWCHLTDLERKHYLEDKRGSVFHVIDPHGYSVCDFLENARRAKKREDDADYARDDPEWLSSQLKGLWNRFQEDYDSCLSLLDGGWNGSEDVPWIMREFARDEDDANTMLDILSLLTVQKECDCDE